MWYGYHYYGEHQRASPLEEIKEASRDIAVDDLGHPNMPTIRHQVEGLCLNTR